MEAGKDNNKEGGIFIAAYYVVTRGIGYVARGGERGKERGPPEKEAEGRSRLRTIPIKVEWSATSRTRSESPIPSPFQGGFGLLGSAVGEPRIRKGSRAINQPMG